MNNSFAEPLATFTNRQRELTVLQGVVESLRRGQPRHVALFGTRRIGKTWLMQRQIEALAAQADPAIRPAYVNLESICTSPEVFVQRYVGLICFWTLAQGRGEVDDFLTVTRLLRALPTSPEVVTRTVGRILNELERRTPDLHFLLDVAWAFPAHLATDQGFKIVLFLDEFPELATLGNYPQVGDPFKLFRAAFQSGSDLAYVVAGSAISVMERLIQHHQSPLFLQFELLPLLPFTDQDSRVMAHKLLPQATPEVLAAIAQYSAGYPFYVTALCHRLERLQESGVDSLSADAVRWAFLLETLSSDGRIYSYCRYLHDISLQKARGYGILKAILQTLAVEEGLTLSEVARRIHKGASPTGEYLRALLEVDLIVKRERQYYFRDPVLRFWVAYTGRGIELEMSPRPEELADLLRVVTERFQTAATELGIAKESQVRELLRRFAGQEVAGIWLGVAGRVRLPTFTQVEPYRAPDGQVEVDALAEAGAGERWAVEIKWRGRLAGVKELHKLQAAAAALAARPWFISKAGFTPEALELARQEGIMVSAPADLGQIARAVRGD